MLSIFAAVLFSQPVPVKSPELALIYHRSATLEPTVSPADLLNVDKGASWAKAQNYWRFTVQDGRTVVYVSESVTGIESANRTAAFFTDLRRQGPGSLVKGSPADIAAREQLRQQFMVSAPSTETNNVAMFPALTISSGQGNITMGGFPSVQADKLPIGTQENPQLMPQRDIYSFNAGSMTLSQSQIDAFQARGVPSPAQVWVAQEQALKVIAPAVEQAQKQVREAYNALATSAVPEDMRDLVSRLPGPVNFDDLPPSVRQHLTNVAERNPGALRFGNSEDALRWLETKPQLQLRMNLMLMMRYRTEAGQVQGVGIALGSGR
jgi:hypothetical protein